ncbi:RtcB family protein [Aridibaculum aurantiacum]|uniref:RtcB family protein n=1 Tax=Aridibaculum aurantiacum TaxID=2810307 RepID=UPI001A97964D|nr:RtcB family protein [Aridibaculum aurantiacum]
MGKLKLRGKQLRDIGYPEAPVISIAMQVMEKHYKRNGTHHVLGILEKIFQDPEAYKEDEVLGKIANELLEMRAKEEAKAASAVDLSSEGVPYNIFGAEFIEEGALSQMNSAARLPISVAGALMPDAHHGYGLPIGGVLATQNAVIPYGVGVDIGCRMCLSIFDIDPKELEFRADYFTRELNEATLFGSGREFKKRSDHDVLYRPEFHEIGILRQLKDKAASQLGSSGGGNHFVEFGIVEIPEADAVLGVPAGKYLGLLSHSGSRAIGANVANHYTKLAKEKRKLPPDAANLAWFTLDEEEGIEYFMAMNLAGDYASACHHVIHEKIAKQLGHEPMKMVENHHNFAWKELYEGKEVIVHRKGATPAGKDVLGIIPGSMTAPGFIVKGKGETASINSASHGAGRLMSRTSAMNNITAKMLKEELAKQGVKLIGGGLDEAPFAYKDIHQVMNAQKQLVDTVGTFTPKIVKMDDTPPRNRKKLDRFDAGE